MRRITLQEYIVHFQLTGKMVYYASLNKMLANLKGLHLGIFMKRILFRVISGCMYSYFSITYYFFMCLIPRTFYIWLRADFPNFHRTKFSRARPKNPEIKPLHFPRLSKEFLLF